MVDRAVSIARLDRDEVIAQREILEAQLARDPSPEVRAAAAAALGFTAHDRRSIPALAAALERETTEDVQRRLVPVLAEFDEDGTAIEAVVRFWLDHPASPVRSEAQSALAGADPRLVCQVLRRVATGRGEVVEPLLRECGCIHDP